MRTRAGRLPAVGAAVLIAVGVGAAASAGPIRDRIYPAPTAPLATSAAGTLALITVRTSDGLDLYGLERAPAPRAPTLLVFHGNGSSAADIAAWLEPLRRAGWGLVAAEYRGYSANPGRPSEAGLARDADAFLAEARRVAAGGRVLVLGHSLGAGVALALAAREPVEVVTVGAFSRLADMTPRLVRPFLPDRYDNLLAVAHLRRPVYLIHGGADDVVPATQLPPLAEAARAAGAQGATFVIPGADHHPDGALLTRLLVRIAAAKDPSEALSPADLPAGVRARSLQAPAGAAPVVGAASA